MQGGDIMLDLKQLLKDFEINRQYHTVDNFLDYAMKNAKTEEEKYYIKKLIEEQEIEKSKKISD